MKYIVTIGIIIFIIITSWLSYVKTYKMISPDKAEKGFVFKDYLNIKEYKIIGGGALKASCLFGEYIEISRSDRHESIEVCK